MRRDFRPLLFAAIVTTMLVEIALLTQAVMTP
jgi:hypothetical protein